jgi:hypothetical protein
MFQDYLKEYAKARPECLHEYRSSPLANDHDFRDAHASKEWTVECHQAQVIDLTTHKWSDVRKSYRHIINRADASCGVFAFSSIEPYKALHRNAFGLVRNDATFAIQERWIRSGHAMTVIAREDKTVSGALWILYQHAAYYASGPSLRKNVQHAVLWHSLAILRDFGVRFVDLGQVDGATEKERNIGTFKSGFGGELRPFLIAKRRA